MNPEANLNPVESQLFIGFSHIVDAFTMSRSDDNIVMDRSFLSGIVYGERTGADQSKLWSVIGPPAPTPCKNLVIILITLFCF